MVLLVGDGMGLNTVAAARIYKGQSREGKRGSGVERGRADVTAP